jgi:hypothetical protein
MLGQNSCIRHTDIKSKRCLLNSCGGGGITECGNKKTHLQQVGYHFVKSTA